MTERKEVSAVATTSFVLGLIPLFKVAGPLAILFGALGLWRIRRSGGLLVGARRAIAGLIMGIIQVSIAVSLEVDDARRAREGTAQRLESDARLKRLMQAGLDLADPRDGSMPDKLDALRDRFTDRELLAMMDLPFTPEAEVDGYALVPGINDWMLPDTVYAYETKPRMHGRIGAITLDGSVVMLRRQSVLVQELLGVPGPEPAPHD